MSCRMYRLLRIAGDMMDRPNSAFRPDWYIAESTNCSFISNQSQEDSASFQFVSGEHDCVGMLHKLPRPFTRLMGHTSSFGISDPRAEIQLPKDLVARSERIQQGQAHMMGQTLNALQELTRKLGVNPGLSKIIANQPVSDGLQPSLERRDPSIDSDTRTLEQVREIPGWMAFFQRLKNKYPKLTMYFFLEGKLVKYRYARLDSRQDYYLKRVPHFEVSIPSLNSKMRCTELRTSA